MPIPVRSLSVREPRQSSTADKRTTDTSNGTRTQTSPVRRDPPPRPSPVAPIPQSRAEAPLKSQQSAAASTPTRPRATSRSGEPTPAKPPFRAGGRTPQATNRAPSSYKAPPAADAPLRRSRSIGTRPTSSGGAPAAAGDARTTGHTRTSSYASPTTRRLSTSSATSEVVKSTPARASSTKRREAERPPSRDMRPPFSTYQQHFSPAKKPPQDAALPARRASLRASTASTVSGASRTTSGTSTATADPLPAQKQKRTMADVRTQTYLLQLSLLHQAAQPTLDAWTLSAHDKLHARFRALQQAYASSLALARSARQARNLLALHRWTGGNVASLSRRLGALSSVLRELCELTAGSPDAEAADNDDTNQQKGAYTVLVAQFTAWADWVEDVWAARDAARGGPVDPDASPPLLPADRMAVAGEHEDQDATFTPIPGVGDGVKASLRSVGSVLERLAQRLEELSSPGIPAVRVALAGSEGGVEDGEVPTPRALVELAAAFVAGMREELQVMRETEFEVVAGERTWVEQRVRRIGGEIEGGFGGVR